MAVNSIFTGVGLTGGPITDTGTINLTPATEVALGGVTLLTSTSSTATDQAATPAAVKIAYDAAVAASANADNRLALTGGTMLGPIVFAAGQTFDNVYLPLATATTPGVVIPSTGLTVSPGGYLTTVNNGTVTSIVAGTGLGAPASGNAITTTGTIKLLPPTIDKQTIGGVKAGPNITIQIDGEISTENLLQTNNPYAYNSYIWPAPTSPVPAAPGNNGSFLTLLNNVTGEVGWIDVVPISTINVSPALTKTQVGTVVNLGLATSGVLPPSSTPLTFGATALIPTFTVNSYGQIISAGEANPYTPFQIPTNTAPFNLVLDFADNNLNWDLTLQGNTVLMNPTNCMSGMKGTIILRQNALTPYALTYSSVWKFPNFSPAVITNMAAAVDLLEFTVVDAAHIIVTNYITNIG